MELLIQSLKNIFLVITTYLFIYYTCKDAFKGLVVYLCFLVLCAFLGFERTLFFEGFTVPIILFLKKYGLSFGGKIEKNLILIILLLIYVILISAVNGRPPFPEFNPIFYGLVMILVLHPILRTEKIQLYFIIMLWLYVLAKMMWFMLHSINPFIINSIDNRLLQVNSDLVLNSDSFRGGIDPNYFGFIMGAGAILSLLMYLYYNILQNKILFLQKYNFIKYIIIIVGVLELFFSLKGLSRGVFISEILSVCMLIYLSKKKLRIYISLISVILIVLIMLSEIGTSILARFVDNDSASRSNLAFEVLNAAKKYGGNLGLWLGGGSNFPWNHYAIGTNESYFNYYSPHNSWLKILIDYGVLGSLLFGIYILKRFHMNWHNKYYYLSKIKIVVMVFVLFIGCSIEPMTSYFGWLLFIVCLI